MKKKSTVKSKKVKILSDEEFDDLFQKSDFSKFAHLAKIVKSKGRPPVGPKISMHFPSELIDELKLIANDKSIGYQTLIRMIVKENVHKYSVVDDIPQMTEEQIRSFRKPTKEELDKFLKIDGIRVMKNGQVLEIKKVGRPKKIPPSADL